MNCFVNDGNVQKKHTMAEPIQRNAKTIVFFLNERLKIVRTNLKKTFVF